MGLEVNPDKISLGETAPGGKLEYTSEYKPAYPGGVKPALCTIAEEIDRELPTPSPLEDLVLACKFAFPPVFLTPPIYNPPTATAEACEDFRATIDVQQTGAATGTFVATPAGTPICGVDIVGNIDVVACEAFNARVVSNITGNGLVGGLTASTTGVPDCGIDLNLDLDLSACTTFTADVSSFFPKAMTGSNFSVIPASAPDCGLDLDLSLALDVCETFEASVVTTSKNPGSFSGSVTSKGTPDCGLEMELDLDLDICETSSFQVRPTLSGVTKSQFSGAFTPNTRPDCGANLDLDLKLDVCEDFTATAKVNPPDLLSGSSFTVTPTGTPNCGVDLVLDLFAKPVCEEFTATVTQASFHKAMPGSSFTASPRSVPACGVDLTLDLNLEVCETFQVGNFNANVNGRHTIEAFASSTSFPDCGLDLDLKLDIKACETFSAKSSPIIINSQFSGLTGDLTVESTSTPDCGIIFGGRLDLNVCETFDASVNITSSTPALGVNLDMVPRDRPDCGLDLVC